MEFGGFIAIEPEFIHCFKKRIKHKVVSKKLRKPLKIKAICSIDKYNKDTKLTEDGNNILRYLLGSESGELYMLAFYLDNLHVVNNLNNVSVQDANSFMIIEFLGSKLPTCSSLEYLDNGYVFYGSRSGESMLI